MTVLSWINFYLKSVKFLYLLSIVLRGSKLWPVFIVCAKRSTTYDMTSPFTNYTKHRLWVLVKTAYMRQF